MSLNCLFIVRYVYAPVYVSGMVSDEVYAFTKLAVVESMEETGVEFGDAMSFVFKQGRKGARVKRLQGGSVEDLLEDGEKADTEMEEDKDGEQEEGDHAAVVLTTGEGDNNRSRRANATNWKDRLKQQTAGSKSEKLPSSPSLKKGVGVPRGKGSKRSREQQDKEEAVKVEEAVELALSPATKGRRGSKGGAADNKKRTRDDAETANQQVAPPATKRTKGASGDKKGTKGNTPVAAEGPNLPVAPQITGFISSYVRFTVASRGSLESPHYSVALVRYVDYWKRCLSFLLLRLKENEVWNHKVDMALSGQIYRVMTNEEGEMVESSKSRDGDVIECVAELLAHAHTRGIKSGHHQRLITKMEQVEKWKKDAHAALQRSSVLTMDNMKLLIQAADKLDILVPHEQIDLLKVELKKAKLWLNKLNGSGLDKGLAMTEDLEKLVPEAENILIDLTGPLDSILQVTKTYCFCRQSFHGNMVGCDDCEEWYHLHCIGLSKAQVCTSCVAVCHRVSGCMYVYCTRPTSVINTYAFDARFKTALNRPVL